MFQRLTHHPKSPARRSFARRLGLLLLLGTFALGACGDDDPTAPAAPTANTGFANGYELANWMTSGIRGGDTGMLITEGTDGEEADFSYAVNLGNPGPGVDDRNAVFGVVAVKSGDVTVEWTYTGFHAFFEAYASLQFFADQGGDTPPEVATEVDAVKTSGNFSFSGSTTLSVVEGENFGFFIGGSNFDSNSRLQGKLHVTKITSPN